ncbi:beta-phosphoglucomutase [Salinimicrobium catena]|uniref:Beta-phosphoglucomutase n=1 Tax=Salinimicrobium catena TaxID=390640 RepID=A0A1H5LF43_9FLAO|nr:beta-phosphoglucomutase [Salinimicrobium catena]SDL08746.1 beta-phosphoglucomutase [Salinimicrobium catena]SEE75001.1 beta-phosphoglucomutase [Salinimicrobium catena]
MNEQRGVIFDLDGVIVDTAKFHFLAWRKLANDLGFDITLEQNEQLKGVSRIHSLEQILNWGGKSISKEEFDRLMITKNEDYLSRISGMSEKDLLPGVKKVLDYLTENNIPYSLGSASKNARPILKSLNIYDRFEAIVDGNDVSKAKPDPEVFLIASEKLKIKPENCVVFEDSVAGVEAAKRANMLSIGIGQEDVLREADHIFADFTQIELEFIEKIVTN